MRFIRKVMIALTALAALPLVAQGLQPVAGTTDALAVTAGSDSTGPGTLNSTDVEAWLDGFLPYALDRGQIPGAVVVVVRGDEVVLQKGYGFTDVAERTPVSAENTLFRPGSVSKLFT